MTDMHAAAQTADNAEKRPKLWLSASVQNTIKMFIAKRPKQKVI